MLKALFFMALALLIGCIYGSIQMYRLDHADSKATKSVITFVQCGMPQRVVFLSPDAVRVARWQTVQTDKMLRRLYGRLPDTRLEMGCWKAGGNQ